MDTTTDTTTNPTIKRGDRNGDRSGDRIMGGSILFVATRCTLQYVVLPFILPFIGLSSTFSIVISAIMEIIALTLIIYNIKRLWHTSWRWRYIGLSVFTVTIILIFLYYDARLLWAV